MKMVMREKFSWEGFTRIKRRDVIEFLAGQGYSKGEARRLFESGAIKIDDRKVSGGGCHFIFYERPFSEDELVEPGMVIHVGRHNHVVIEAIHHSFLERVYYQLRDVIDRIKDIKVNGRYVIKQVL